MQALIDNIDVCSAGWRRQQCLNFHHLLDAHQGFKIVAG
jgi:hypothetical protein